jgi:hypothetical protein
MCSPRFNGSGLWHASRRRRTPLRSPMAEARREIIREALGQAWARDGVPDQYLAADAVRLADRVRRNARDDGVSWELLMQAAHLTTEAEAMLARGGA